ncbi:hypothetical protein phytr_2610 [Candidatus Phycorickettsia trachydisci]|uniref:Uncharacterized protein n=1 Tax=Candidatus Phycorickettsia trachydisci TaxID=2115978 RepID=A0A2P1P7H1_9RICK|nr:ankyrin repeat domain-containing protein [Candidatus Phycorickettsia trachydisci]AVP87217.1 hypothetical protein phytr_2610 [Candidatus Phycorickettsia trachydisci]
MTDKFELLDQAIVNNNLQEVQSLLAEDTGRSIISSFDFITPAAKAGNIAILKYLMPYVQPQNTAILSTAMGYAVEEGHIEIVKYLIDQGANLPDRRVHYANTNILQLAAFNNDLEMVKYLISQGGGLYDGVKIVRRKDKKNDLVEKLKEKNSSQVLEYLKDIEVFSRAVESGDLEMIKSSLEKGIDPNIRVTYLETGNTAPKATPLCQAAMFGHKDVVKYLVENGAEVNYKFSTNYQLYPLHVAAENGHLEIVKYLVQNGADIHTKSVSNKYDCLSDCTPLDLAVVKGHLEIVKYLHEELVADLNCDHVIDQDKNSIIHIVAQRGYVKVMQYLLNTGLSPDVKNEDGDTPLLLATWSNHLEMVKFLLDKVVDIGAKGKSNRNVLDIALAAHKRIDIVLEIMDHPEYLERLIDDTEFLDHGIGDSNYRASKAILLLQIINKITHYNADETLINKVYNKYHQEIKKLDETIQACQKEFSEISVNARSLWSPYMTFNSKTLAENLINLRETFKSLSSKYKDTNALEYRHTAACELYEKLVIVLDLLRPTELQAEEKEQIKKVLDDYLGPNSEGNHFVDQSFNPPMKKLCISLSGKYKESVDEMAIEEGGKELGESNVKLTGSEMLIDS